MCPYKLFTLLCVVLVNMHQTRGQPPVVNTRCGPIEGISKDGAFSFRGIPFAKPPVGSLRWKAPVPVDCWTGTLNAHSFGESCYQPSLANISVHWGSEDCLFVNVWTPNTSPNARLSVMVWIHGGMNEYMSGNWPRYSPTEKLAKYTNIVYVSMNYRLHALGYMALDLISQSSPTGTSGNYGLMDQILALQWVQRHVRYFGGDPKKVTVFGQSSGGTNIFALLASKMAVGLFQKAWMSSASPILDKTLVEASRDNLVFLRNTGCSDLDCLLRMSPGAITRAVPWDVFPNWSMMDLTDLPMKGEAVGALPIIDGYVLKQEPMKAWLNGDGIDVPLMIGTTAQEIDFLPAPLDVPIWTWDQYDKYVYDKLSTFGVDVAQAALKFYPRGIISPEYQFTTMATDIRMTCPTEILSMTAALSYTSPVYRYVVKSWPSKPTYVIGFPFPASYAFHCWEFLAFFDSIKHNIDNPSQSDISFQENVQRTMLSFVKDEEPDSCWAPYSQSTAILTNRITYVRNYKPRECQFWSQKGFFKFGWFGEEMWIKVLCVVAFSVLLNTCRAENPRVTTDCGDFEGVENDGAYSFRGIPFAEPPLGELRWKAPVPFTGNCTDVFDARNFGEACYQPHPLDTDGFFGSEDCLFVNVWTPTLDPTAKLPVMVWIHGGYNAFLSGSWPDYMPKEKVAYDTNVVYVSMNYRLHAFGFMALDLISESSPTNTSGNYGLMDQIEALKWVQKKISYFGGDPNKVTIIGQSSGGTDAYALLASKLAEGLFVNVWMSSGSPVLSKTTAEASEDNLFFLNNTGCTTLACLKSLPPENITRAIPWFSFPNWAMEDMVPLPKSDEAIGALPVVDGYVLEDEPRKAWKRYKNDVPILIGSTAQELDFSPQADIVNWTWTRYNEEVKAKLSTFSDYVAETALLLYPAGEISPEYQYTTMCTDVRVNCALDIISMEAALNFRSPIYRYVTTAWPSKPTSVVGFPFQAKYAFHCIDFLAYFDTLRNTINPLSPSDIKFQRNIRKAVLSFVRNGKPSARWGQFEETTVLLSERIEFVDGYNVRECQFWLNNGFYNYSWIN
ncbi:hypothetical protein ScPMuIL_011813 [Solemya velum]